MSRPSPRLTSLMVWMVFIAFILALFARVTLAALRESTLWQQLGESWPKESTLKPMAYFLSDDGIDILKRATDVELLRVSRYSDENEVVPTGLMLGEAMALRVACVLMDHRCYRPGRWEPFSTDWAPPSPTLIGLRFRGENLILDVLVESGGSGRDLREVWFEIHDEARKTVHSTGWPILMQNPELQRLAEPLLHSENPK